MIVEGVICPICKDVLYPNSNKTGLQFCKCCSIGIIGGIFIKDIFTYSKICIFNKKIKMEELKFKNCNFNKI